MGARDFLVEVPCGLLIETGTDLTLTPRGARMRIVIWRRLRQVFADGSAKSLSAVTVAFGSETAVVEAPG